LGYRGGHTDSTSPEFIAKVVCPLLLGDRRSVDRP
jgi:hypothetical protein